MDVIVSVQCTVRPSPAALGDKREQGTGAAQFQFPAACSGLSQPGAHRQRDEGGFTLMPFGFSLSLPSAVAFSPWLFSAFAPRSDGAPNVSCFQGSSDTSSETSEDSSSSSCPQVRPWAGAFAINHHGRGAGAGFRPTEVANALNLIAPRALRLYPTFPLPRSQADPWAQVSSGVAFQWQSHPRGMLVPDLGLVSASAGPLLRRRPQLHIPGVPGERPRAGIHH